MHEILKQKIMKKIFLAAIFAMTSFTLWAQDNTWERIEQEDVKEQQGNRDQKYLRGAVPVVDGRVEFRKVIEAPGKSAAQIYDIVLNYMEKMTQEKNQIRSQIVFADTEKHEIGGSYEEWLVFKAAALALDRTRLYYVLDAKCSDGQADITITRIHYLYEEERKPQRLKAEEWITDDEAVNKKNTKLLPVSAKFRRKTIDRKDFLFNKFESLLK